MAPLWPAHHLLQLARWSAVGATTVGSTANHIGDTGRRHRAFLLPGGAPPQRARYPACSAPRAAASAFPLRRAISVGHVLDRRRPGNRRSHGRQCAASRRQLRGHVEGCQRKTVPRPLQRTRPLLRAHRRGRARHRGHRRLRQWKRTGELRHGLARRGRQGSRRQLDDLAAAGRGRRAEFARRARGQRRGRHRPAVSLRRDLIPAQWHRGRGMGQPGTHGLLRQERR